MITQPLDMQLKRIEDVADELHTLVTEVYGSNSDVEMLALRLVGLSFAAYCDSITAMTSNGDD